jgi:hypothetical protein
MGSQPVPSEESKPPLFVMRIWVDPARSPARVSRGMIEHVPSGEHRYFRDLGEVQAFVTSRLSSLNTTTETDLDAD